MAAELRAPSASLDLRSGHPYWLLHDGFGDAEAPLTESCSTDVVVVGAGVTGALVTRALVAAGLRVVVIDRRHAGLGSTCASTALLQYETDTSLRSLSHQYGAQRAEAAYQAALEALVDLRAVATSVGEATGLQEVDSLYVSSTAADLAPLREEFSARERLGVDVEWIDDRHLRDRYECTAPGAILSHGDASINPLTLTRAVLKQATRKGAEVYGHTSLVKLTRHRTGVRAITEAGSTVSADFAVICAGYESLSLLPPGVASLRATYALATETVDKPAPAFINTMFWETARPYLYGRSTPDGRYLLGGEDIADPGPAVRDALVGAKAATVLGKCQRLFPSLDARAEYAWAGTFAETPDGLPYIGAHADTPPNVLYALCFGGNGITFASIAASMLRDRILGRAHPLDQFFGFERSHEPAGASRDGAPR